MVDDTILLVKLAGLNCRHHCRLQSHANPSWLLASKFSFLWLLQQPENLWHIVRSPVLGPAEQLQHRLMVHLLDDFLTVTQISPLLVVAFLKKLGVPLSHEKTSCPAHSLEFLGISGHFITSLPKEKIYCIITIITCFISSSNKTKPDLKSYPCLDI